VPKRILLLTSLVAAMLATSTGTAQAEPFYLQFSDGVNPAVLFTDGLAGDSNTDPGWIQVNTTIGNFSVIATVATLTDPGSGQLEFRVGMMRVTSLTGTGTLSALLWRNDLSPLTLGLGSPVTASSSVTGTFGTPAAGSVAITNKVNGTTVFSTTIPGVVTTGSTPLVSPLGDPFSLSSRLDFTFTKGSLGTITATDSLLLKGSVTPVPEPTTLLLFGPGMLGLLALRWPRRRSKTA
jgi:hypothetical protein